MARKTRRPSRWRDSCRLLSSMRPGGSDFDVSDLQATVKSSPALIVLDGLDEVAEVKQRQRVAEEITSAIPRLSAVGYVTSSRGN